MGTFLDINLDGIYEPKVAEADSEVHLRVADAVLGSKKSDESSKRIEVTVTDPADPEFRDFTMYLPIPDENTDKKKANMMKKRIKDFYECFGVDYSRGVEASDLIGCEGFCILGVDDDPEYGKKNFVRRFIVGH